MQNRNPSPSCPACPENRSLGFSLGTLCRLRSPGIPDAMDKSCCVVRNRGSTVEKTSVFWGIVPVKNARAKFFPPRHPRHPTNRRLSPLSSLTCGAPAAWQCRGHPQPLGSIVELHANPFSTLSDVANGKHWACRAVFGRRFWYSPEERLRSVLGLKPCHYQRNPSGLAAVAACVWFVPCVCLRLRPEGPISCSPGRSPGSGAPKKIRF